MAELGIAVAVSGILLAVLLSQQLLGHCLVFEFQMDGPTQFRQWATQILKDHLVHGYTLNRQRLEERGV